MPSGAVAAIAAENCCDSERSSKPGSGAASNLLFADAVAAALAALAASCFVMSVSVSLVDSEEPVEDDETVLAEALATDTSCSPLIVGSHMLLSMRGSIDELFADDISASARSAAEEDVFALLAADRLLDGNLCKARSPSALRLPPPASL